ncbi:chemotaxis protein CheW [Pseudoxanthomonas mexicana]|uniref:chemotaxis protein CheW n=1 Tax=Pseudoxanthomonas mexicana TaxID=128785 RepID=UPI0007832EB1|nr:chemotaxis protein CheW [Pseudoxanthomonas mexicana]
MSTPAVLDDYLLDLLGDAATAPATSVVAIEPATPVVTSEPDEVPAPVAPPIAPAPTLAVAPTRPGAEADLISDDEFEALLDQLHGGGAPVAVTTPVAAPVTAPSPALAVAPVRAGSADMIGDDEFEALLDELHGGAAPTTRVPEPPAPAAPAVAPAAPLAPPTMRGLAPLPAKPFLLPEAPDGGQRRRATERKTRWLRLRCDEQHYALELLKVQEVVRPATLLPLRGAAAHMLGVMNLRGQVVPVIDLGLYLGRRSIDVDATTRIVVLEEHGETLGLRVSAVEDVANLTDHQIESPDNARVGRIANPLFRGVARLNECPVILLDASRILQ